MIDLQKLLAECEHYIRRGESMSMAPDVIKTLIGNLKRGEKSSNEEPVAEVVLGKREISCHGPNRRYIDGPVIRELAELEVGTKLFTHSQPAPNSCTRSHPHEKMDAMCELRTEIARLTNKLANIDPDVRELVSSIELFLETVEEPPKRNCSCHLSPPCRDCFDYSGLREAFEVGRAMKAKHGGEV